MAESRKRTVKPVTEAIVVQRAYDLQLWIMERAGRFPKQVRYHVGEKLIEASIELTLALVDAAYLSDKSAALALAMRLVNRLRFLVRMSLDLKLMAAGSAGFASEKLEEIGRMTGGWAKAVARKA